MQKIYMLFFGLILGSTNLWANTDMRHDAHQHATPSMQQHESHEQMSQKPKEHSMDHAAMDHAAMTHENMQHDSTSSHAASMAKQKGALSKLSIVPSSGKSREAGFDERYAMESTSHDKTKADNCALASRGLIMLDNAAWKECGGKPQGLPSESQDISSVKDSEHQGHGMHK